MVKEKINPFWKCVICGGKFNSMKEKEAHSCSLILKRRWAEPVIDKR